MINYSRLRELYKRDGEKRFTLFMVNEMINAKKVVAAEVSIRGLWEAMGQPDLNRAKRLLSSNLTEAEFSEAMDSSAFAKITGALINRMVIDAYEATPAIGLELVTTIPSSVRDDTVVGFTAEDAPEEVEEGMPYEEGAFGEKYYRIRNRKWGRILSLTEEMVKFDQTGQMVQRANRAGIAARERQEEYILRVITGYVNSGAFASWRPNGTATTLYSDTSTDPADGSNPTSTTFDNVNTNALTDHTDVEENYVLLAAATNEKGRPISVNPDTILTSPSKIFTARRIVESTSVLSSNVNAGIKNLWTGLRPASSPWITTFLGANYWLIGQFRKQFVRTEVFPLQTFQAKAGNDEEFERDTVMRVKVRYMEGCGAVGNKFVVRSTGAS